MIPKYEVAFSFLNSQNGSSSSPSSSHLLLVHDVPKGEGMLMQESQYHHHLGPPSPERTGRVSAMASFCCVAGSNVSEEGSVHGLNVKCVFGGSLEEQTIASARLFASAAA